MAFAYTIGKKTVFGDMRVNHGVIVCDNTSGSVASGLDVIESVSWAPKSSTTMIGTRFLINALPAGTAAVGTLALSGVTSGDELYVTVYRR
jgi:hypothetical protein